MKKFKILIFSMVISFIIPINIFADTSTGNEDMPPENTLEVKTVEDSLIDNGEYMPSSVTGKKFTGTGTVVDYSINEQKSFFVIETKDREIYYLIIDNEKQTDNAYFLREINETELKFDESFKKEEVQPIIKEETPVKKKKDDLIPTLIIFGILGAGGIYAYLHPEIISKLFKKKNKQNSEDDIYLEEDDEEIFEDEVEEVEEQEE